MSSDEDEKVGSPLISLVEMFVLFGMRESGKKAISLV